MASILTNTGAMVALQTLRGINQNMGKTQSDISTGKSVATAKDNAAVWAISKVMESDVMGFKGISTSLALGSSTVSTARSAAEKITTLLGEVKEKIVASQEENQDRAKIQQDIVALRDQISSIVGAAQFNGLNLLGNSKGGGTVAEVLGNTGAGLGVLGSSKVSVLSSLDRSGTATVVASQIGVTKADLGTHTATFGTGAALGGTPITAGAAVAVATSVTFTVAGDATTGRTTTPVLAGDGYRITGFGWAGGTPAGGVTYVARDGDTVTDVAKGLIAQINFDAAEHGLKISAELTGTAGIKITNNTAAAFTTVMTTSTGGKAGGGLTLLGAMDVSTKEGASAALSAIEGLTQTAIKAAADFGSAQKRIEIQKDFVNSLTDSLKAGIGSLVDADMEEASARLQALQVQQQLGIQALSIANQAPQNILSLFR